jgi:hypothetical protein
MPDQRRPTGPLVLWLRDRFDGDDLRPYHAEGAREAEKRLRDTLQALDRVEPPAQPTPVRPVPARVGPGPDAET